MDQLRSGNFFLSFMPNVCAMKTTVYVRMPSCPECPRLALIFKGFASLHAARLIIAYKCLTYINKLSVVKEKPSREWSTLEGL